MVSNLGNEKMLNKKLQVLKAVTRSTSDKRSGILMDAVTYIDNLTKKLDEMIQEYDQLMQEIQADDMEDMVVKVEKLEDGCFAVKITCEKTQELLFAMIDAFEKMGLEIVQADIDTSVIFDLEAVMETDDESLDAEDITETIYEVIETKGVKYAGSDDEED